MKLLKRSRSLRARDGAKEEIQTVQQNSVTKEQLGSDCRNRKSILPERPKSATARKSFHRPKTAEKAIDRSPDLQIPGQTIEIKAGNDTFSFPTPSPQLPPPPRSATFQAAPSPLAADDAGIASPIGVAIGSPRQALSLDRSFSADQVSSRMARQASRSPMPAAIPEQSETEPMRPQLKKQKSAWKTLGTLFTRKPSKPAVQEPFYKVQMQPPDLEDARQHPVQIRARATFEMPSPLVKSPKSISSHHSRVPSASRGLARLEARAEADKASFMPIVNDKLKRTPSMIQPRGSMVPLMKPLCSLRASEDIYEAAEPGGRYSSLSAVETLGAVPRPRQPRLDVSIPNVEMERYSVMFEKLLEPKPKPSLLERRQSKLKRLASVQKHDTSAEAMTNVENTEGRSVVIRRSMTSPHLTRMPPLTVHVQKKQEPAENLRREALPTSIHRPRPLQRSKTAPPVAASPVATQLSMARPASQSSLSSPVYSENSLPSTPTSIAMGVDKCDSIAVMSHEQMPIIPRNETNWDMITSKPFRMTISSPKEDENPDPYLRVKSPEDLERHMVQVSVARQVSVSNARRHVQKAVCSKQALRPRVVELTKNRKSTVVLIESGDE